MLGGGRRKNAVLEGEGVRQASQLPVLVQCAASQGKDKLTIAFLGMGCEQAWKRHQIWQWSLDAHSQGQPWPSSILRDWKKARPFGGGG